MTTILATASVTLGDTELLPSQTQRQLRRADDFIRLAVAAAHQVLSIASRPVVIPEQTALFLGSCFGPMQCNFEVIDNLAESEVVSPLLFSHSVFNAAAGYVTRIFQIQGGSWTTTSFGSPLFSCLENACACIRRGLYRQVLVLQVESFSELLHDAKQQFLKKHDRTWPAGAVAFLLIQDKDCNCRVKLEKMICNCRAASFYNYLIRNELLEFNGHAKDLHDPLAAGRELCRIIDHRARGRQTLDFIAPWGHTSINLARTSRAS